MRDFMAGIFGICATVAGAVGLVFLCWWLWPQQVAVEREVLRKSHQYVESKRSLLIQLAAELESPDCTENQRKAILARIRAEADNLDPAEIPASVTKYTR